MSRIIDNLITFRILSMLVKPFDETDAYKLGIIDKNGKKLRDPKTEEEKDSYDYLSKLTFNLKKLLNKLPGGDTKIKNIVAALFLIKESYKNNSEYISESELKKIIDSNVILAEETLLYRMFVEDGEGFGGGGISGQGQTTTSTIPTNKTGPETSTDIPVLRKKKPVIFKRQPLKQAVIVTQPKTY